MSMHGVSSRMALGFRLRAVFCALMVVGGAGVWGDTGLWTGGGAAGV